MTSQRHPLAKTVRIDLPAVQFDQDEIETGRATDLATDWRRFLAIFDGLGKEERSDLILLDSLWAELDSNNRILLRELAKALVARKVQ